MVAIVGPTGAGKSALAMAVAERTGAEVLSVDSMQVYEDLDVGTAKPTLEERTRVRHHMIDVTQPEQAYTVADFRRDARRALADTTARRVLVVGGSGLHFRSVVDPMRFRPFDPEVREALRKRPLPELVAELLAADDRAGALVDLANHRRVLRSVEAYRISGITPSSWAEQPQAARYRRYEPELEFVGFALDLPDIEPAIEARLATMWKQGLVQEVERMAPRLGPTASRGVGYRQLLDVVAGRRSEQDGRDLVKRVTMALVKRQRTFFRRDPRLRWLDGSNDDTLSTIIQAVSS